MNVLVLAGSEIRLESVGFLIQRMVESRLAHTMEIRQYLKMFFKIFIEM